MKLAFFHQSPSNHLIGANCPKCTILRLAQEKTLTENEYISRAKKVHGRKYDYSLVSYKNNYSLVTIICKKHGSFQQIANAHIQGHGCSSCQQSRGENAITSFLGSKGIHYIPQWKDHDCKFKRKLRFDFYIPDHKLIIEYDGIQHFKPISFGGKKDKATVQKDFELIRLKDSIKAS